MSRKPSKPKVPPYLSLERKIAADERGGVMHRWEYGHELLPMKNGRRQLPHGLLTELIVAATRAGFRLSEREIRRRIQCASAYATKAEVGQALADFGSWSALAEAGFPAVEVDEEDQIDSIEAAEAAGIHLGPPDDITQLELDLPGLPATIKVNDRKVPIDQASLAEVKGHRETFRQIHENFGKTLQQMDHTIALMEAGATALGLGDSANALQAYRRALAIRDDLDHETDA